ncbi:PucR family transcriptional regulator [Siminovitchia sp. 179-K 8D1 HS]
MMITVRDMQKELIQENIRLIAGEKGLDRIIEHVNVQEFPFKSTRVYPNTLVLTTFYGFKDTNEIIEHFEWYVKIGVSGVCMHNVVYSEVPEKVVKLANEIDLPLFFIPKKISYNTLYEKYNDLIYQEKTKLKNEIDQLNQSMLNALLHEKDNHFIIQSIGKYLNEPIIYLNQEMNIVSLWNSGQFSRLGLKERLDEVTKVHRESFNEVRITRKAVEVKAPKTTALSYFQILPVNNKLDFYGYLIIGQENPEVPFRDMIIKNALTALILDAMKKNQIKEFHKNKDIKLLEEIFLGKRDSEIVLEDFYFDIRNIHYLLIAEPEDKSTLRELYHFIEKKVVEDVDGLVWIMNKKVFALTQKQLKEDKELALSGKKLRIGLSGKLKAFTNRDLKMMYEQAGVALHFSHIQGKDIGRWEELGFEKITYFLGKSDLLKDYHLDYLQPLIDYDQKNDTNFIHTLYVYLKTFFSLKESGEKLHLHPNTVKYRVNKIEELLGMKVDDPNHYMNLMLAFKSYFYLAKAKEISI